jgi:hypothetical protein
MTKQTRWLQGRLRRSGFGDQQRNIQPIPGLAGLQHLGVHCNDKVALMPQGKAVHGSHAARQWRLRRHCLQRREFHRLAQQFLYGAATVRGKWLSAQPRGPVVDKPSLAVLGMGNASTGHNSPISGRQMAPVVSLCDFVRREYAAGNSSVFLVMVDEWRTSKVCSRCWRPQLQQYRVGPRGAKEQCWKLKHCHHRRLPRCPRHVVDRDVNAARNITALLVHQLYEGHVDERQQQMLGVFRR